MFYILGLQNQYILHSFASVPINLDGRLPPRANEAMCHSYHISLTTHDPSLDLPPFSMFNWHYIQCIIKKFATTDYWAFNNIYHFVQPFRMRDGIEDEESDRDFDDDRNIPDPSYPMYLRDLSELRECQRLEGIEHHRGIVAWSSSVSVS